MQTFLPDGGTYYKTTQEITIRASGEDSSRGYTVPAGFIFNISVPEKYWWYISPHDERYFEAAAVHDYVLAELKWTRWQAAFPFFHHLKGKVNLPTRAFLFILLGVLVPIFRLNNNIK